MKTLKSILTILLCVAVLLTAVFLLGRSGRLFADETCTGCRIKVVK